MKRSHAALIVVAIAMMLGLLAVQIWVQQRQLSLQRAQTELWRAQVQAQSLAAPGQPAIPPPIVWQPPIFMTWSPLFFPLLMAPLWLVGVVQEQRRQELLQAEEEDKTPYAEEELMQNWEFKIIRNPAGLFERPAFLERILQEESRAGWRLVEKFDGTRVRLKRLVAEQPPALDLPQGYDPYRTAVALGPKPGLDVMLLQPLFILCLVCVPAFILMGIFGDISTLTFLLLLSGAVAGSVVSGFWALRQTAKYKKSAFLT